MNELSPVGAKRLLRKRDVLALLGIKDTQPGARIRRGEFPRPVRSGDGERGTAFWFADEVVAYLERLRRKRDAVPETERQAQSKRLSPEMRRLSKASLAKRRTSPASTRIKKRDTR